MELINFQNHLYNDLIRLIEESLAQPTQQTKSFL